MPLLNGKPVSRLAFAMGMLRHNNLLSEAEIAMIATAMGMIHNAFESRPNVATEAVKRTFLVNGHTHEEFLNLTTPQA